MRFDFFGKLVAEPKQGGIEIALETVRAKAVPSLDTGGYQAARWFRSTVHVKPNEIVDVALRDDHSDEKEDAFTKRVFSIRIRAKRIR